MPKVPESRRVGRVAVNEVRSLLERNGHIVQEIDGANDHGEDLHVTFVQDGQRTADSLAVQVKGGVSARTRRGYRVQVGDHGDNWRDGSLPVLCVVHDPERGGLFWANATRQLRRAEALRKTLKSVVVRRESVLDDSASGVFVSRMRSYLAREREGVGRWADMADVEFAPNDIVKPFTNDCGEPMVFWQKRGIRSPCCCITTSTGSPCASSSRCFALSSSRRLATSSLTAPKRTGSWVASSPRNGGADQPRIAVCSDCGPTGRRDRP